MERLWGEVAPVPAERVRALSGGERLGPGGDGPFRVAYTPGHARHHVSYLHEPTGLAFTGDVAGVRIGDGPVFAPTPPPDVDVDGWRKSLETIAAWRPAGLCLTHFGRYDKVDEHLARVWDSLRGTLDLARTLDEQAFAAAQRAMMPQAAYAHATVPSTTGRGPCGSYVSSCGPGGSASGYGCAPARVRAGRGARRRSRRPDCARAAAAELRAGLCAVAGPRASHEASRRVGRARWRAGGCRR